MPRGGKDETAKSGDVGRLRNTADDNVTFSEALSKVGFKPATVGRRIVPQGKRREMLKKRASKDADK